MYSVWCWEANNQWLHYAHCVYRSVQVHIFSLVFIVLSFVMLLSLLLLYVMYREFLAETAGRHSS